MMSIPELRRQMQIVQDENLKLKAELSKLKGEPPKVVEVVKNVSVPVRKVIIKEVEVPVVKIVEKLVPGPERIVYRDGPERIVYKDNPKHIAMIKKLRR